MGLYLVIFDAEHEVEGVEVGSYADFDMFRDAVVAHVEAGAAGARCPMLILHSDCDGEWSPREAQSLQQELAMITKAFLDLPPEPLGSVWKAETVNTLGLRLDNLYDCFFDVDGEPLLDRLMGLAQLSVKHDLPILFQ